MKSATSKSVSELRYSLSGQPLNSAHPRNLMNNNYYYRITLVVTLLLPGFAQAQSDQSITLLATEAKLSGPSVRMNNDTHVAAWWKGTDDRATWRFKVDKASNVDVLLVYGVPNHLANQPLVVALDEKTVIESKLPGTGSYTNFHQVAIGTVRLAPGDHRLTFRPAQQVRGDDLVDLKAVILAPHDPNRARSTPAPKMQPDAPNLQPVTDMLKHIRVPEGFVIEQVAGPPLVNRPISVDFDERGRLYVTESSGTNDKVQKQLAELPHRVIRLEDVDGDGVFDKRTVFADRMMFPEGALWHDGSLYVAAPPHIWKLTDINDDGIADKREVWFEGTLGGCANDLHGPYLGPDGWLYWCKGEFAEQTYERPGQPPLVTRAAHIFRRHPSGGPVEIVMTGGMNNPVDVAFTPGGERIFTTTFLQRPAGGKRDGLIHAVYGGVYPRKNGVVDGHPRTGELMPVLTHMGVAAPCGLIRLASDQLGDGFQDNLLACQFNTHKVSRHVLAPRGATYITQDEDFLTSDHIDFHPTDVLEDADGSVLVVNTGGWYMLCCPTSRMHKPDVLGAIYRVRRAEKHKIEDPRGQSIKWMTLSADQIAELLSDPRPAVRRRALGLLVSQGKDAVPSLARVIESRSPHEARLQAVWALTRIDHQQARAAVRTALSDPDEQVRQAAIHCVALWRDSSAIDELRAMLTAGSQPATKGNPTRERGTLILRDSVPRSRVGLPVGAATHMSLHNRRAAAEAIGRIGDKDAIDDLLAAAADYRGRVLEHSLVYALIEIGDAQLIEAGLASDAPHTRRAAMLALDNLADGGLQPDSVIGLLDSDDPLTADAAWWITQRHPEWADAMAGFFRKRIADPKLAPETLAPLSRHLARFSESPEIQKIMATGLGNANVPRQTKLAILDAIAASHTRAVPQAWWTELARLIAMDDDEVIARAVSAIHAHSPSPLADELKQVAAAPRLPMETRLRALASSIDGEQLDDGLMQMLTSELSAAQPVRNRSLAIDVILNAKLSDGQLVFLATTLTDTASMDLARLLQAFEKSASVRVGEKLVEALSECPAATALKLESVRGILGRYGSSINEQAGPLLARIEAATHEKAAKFDVVLQLIGKGDVRRGQEVFFGTKAACSACHSIGYLGGKVGPDLTNIGRIRDDRSLLESILYPSASFVQSYEPTTILTVDGHVHSGVIKEETSDEVTLSLDAEKVVRIGRDEIEQRAAGTVSIMPTGLEKQLSPQQLADLVVFLKNAK